MLIAAVFLSDSLFTNSNALLFTRVVLATKRLRFRLFRDAEGQGHKPWRSVDLQLASALSAAYFGRVSARPFSYLCVRCCTAAVPLAALPFVLLLLLLLASRRKKTQLVLKCPLPPPSAKYSFTATFAIELGFYTYQYCFLSLFLGSLYSTYYIRATMGTSTRTVGSIGSLAPPPVVAAVENLLPLRRPVPPLLTNELLLTAVSCNRFAIRFNSSN
jgi:hypothetical protein